MSFQTCKIFSGTHVKGLGPDSLSQHLISLLFHSIKMHADSTVILPYTSFDVPQKKSQVWKNMKDLQMMTDWGEISL